MNSKLLKSAFLTHNPHIREEQWLVLESHLVEQQLGRRKNLFQAGTLQTYIGFINKGLIREFFIDKEGRENTVWFFKENNFVTDYPSFLQNIPTKNTFICLEPTELILIPRDIILQAYDSNPAFDRVGRLIAEGVLIQLQDRIDSFHFLSAEERYLKYIKKYPDLFQRISLTHLSSFLGIQRPSLSRIRKNLS